ncbi:AAA family ATPase [Streptomyces sp. Ju416(a)]|uniref:AAA family ATPase n=1 Tax=Streptomyces sp. Ju416(a) TaxID=3446591 RepID=UPI00403DB438
MSLPRYVLAPTHLTGDTFGWQLTRTGGFLDTFLDCHETFAPTADRDLSAALTWAERIIGSRHHWRYTTEGGPERWTATDDREATGADVLRSLEPGTLLVAVGPGGSGKSTFAERAGLVTVVSLDSLREEIGGDAGDQTVTPAAVRRQNRLLSEHLAEGTPVYVDSTNVEVSVRAGLIEQARRHGRPIVSLRFVPHLDICLARNALRPVNRQVPDHVLARQHDLALAATPQALIAEGFTSAHDIVTPL